MFNSRILHTNIYQVTKLSVTETNSIKDFKTKSKVYSSFYLSQLSKRHLYLLSYSKQKIWSIFLTVYHSLSGPIHSFYWRRNLQSIHFSPPLLLLCISKTFSFLALFYLQSNLLKVQKQLISLPLDSSLRTETNSVNLLNTVYKAYYSQGINSSISEEKTAQYHSPP